MSSSTASSSEDAPALPIPALPDLRFEQSYLATVRQFLHEPERTTSEPGLWHAPLHVEWLPLIYVTIRDQVLSPLVQGAVWGLGGILLSQFRTYLQATRRAGPPPQLKR